MVKSPNVNKIVPGPFDRGIADEVAKAVKMVANKK